MLHAVTPLTICGAFVFGIVLALIGSLKLTLMRKLELRETHVGALLSVLNLSLLPMMLIAGILLDDFGARIVMLIGSLGTATGLYFAGLSKSLSQTAASILVVGAGSAFLSVGSVVLMDSAFYPDKITASQNLGNVFFRSWRFAHAPVARNTFGTIQLSPGTHGAGLRRIDSRTHGPGHGLRCVSRSQ